MTNPAAVIGLTYDGTDLQENPIGIFLELVDGLWTGRAVRGVDVVVPASVGRSAKNRVLDRIVIRLEGYVAGQGDDEADQRTDFTTTMTTLRTLFDPARDPATLLASLPDGTTAAISARPLPSMLTDQIVPTMARLSVELEAVEDWDFVTGS